MRQLLLALVTASVAAGCTPPARTGNVLLAKIHICCGQCEEAVREALGGVDGVSSVRCDRNLKTVTFEARDRAAMLAGVQALWEHGFYGTVIMAGKEIAVEAPALVKAAKEGQITVNGVHICCGQCKRELSTLVNGAKVDFPGPGQVRYRRKNLDSGAVLRALREAGFNGTIAE